MALVGPILSAVGAGIGLIGSLKQGQATQQQNEYQAAVARNNQIIAEQNAEYARQAGMAQAQQESLKAAQQVAGVKAAEAANNVDVNTGSNLEVYKGQREAANLSALNVESNALLQAYGYESTATQYGAQAGLYQSAASNAVPASILSGAGGVLGKGGDLPLAFQALTASGSTTGASERAASGYDPTNGILYANG